MEADRSDELRRFGAKLWLSLAFLAGIAAVYLLRSLLLLTFVSMLVALVWTYLADALVALWGGKLPRGAAIILAMVLSLGLLVAVGVLLFGPLNEQLSGFMQTLPELLQNAWMRLHPILRRLGLGSFDPATADLSALTGGLLTSGLSLLNVGFQAVSGVVGVLFLAFFWAMNPARYRAGALGLLPPRAQSWAGRILDEVSYTLRQWMKATGMSMLTIAVLTTLLLWLLGIPYALLFGVAAGIFEIIPFLGPVLAFTGPGLYALGTSPTTALWVTAGWIFVQTVEGNLVVPFFLSKAAELPPALTIFIIFAMGELFGFLGIFVASPALALMVAVVRAIYGYKDFKPGAT